MAYWDIDSLLAEEEPVKIQFKGTVHGIGFLDPVQTRDNFEDHDTLRLPIWMAIKVMDHLRMDSSAEC